jgi:hypothetical protein
VIATDACCIQLDILEQDVFEILHLIRSWRNRLAPVNRIPPEILALIPDFWNDDDDEDDKGRSLITLTHVCQAWREVFISRPSLWTDLDCKGEDKTRVYLERSKSLPVSLSLNTANRLPPYRPFSDIIPHVIERLGSLTLRAAPEELQDITGHLSRPAPRLEKLFICGNSDSDPRHNPVLTPALFNGDLSLLRKLHLESVYTELPWRNMVSLTSFSLLTRCRVKSPSDSFLTSSRALLASASRPPLRNPGPWCSKSSAVGITGVSGGDGDHRLWFGFPLAQPLVDPGWGALKIEVESCPIPRSRTIPPDFSITSGTYPTSPQSNYPVPTIGNHACNSAGRMGKSI